MELIHKIKLEDVIHEFVAESKSLLQEMFPQIVIKGVQLSFENDYCGYPKSIRFLVFMDNWNRTGSGQTLDEAYKDVILEIANYVKTQEPGNEVLASWHNIENPAA